MPNITVNERDLSWYYRQSQTGQLVVLMPGVSSFGPTNRPTIVNQDNFYQILGRTPINSNDLSFSIAESFVKSGIDVLFWRLELDGQAVASFSAGKGVLLVQAKYPGTYGNALKVACSKVGDSFRFYVYDLSNGNKLVERNIVNFVNPDSEYWYENINESSNYLNFTPSGEVDNLESDFTLKGGINYAPLEDGKTFKDFVIDTLSDKTKSSQVVQELRDPFIHYFNVAISAGYSIKESDAEVSQISPIDDMFIGLCEKRGNAVYFVDGTPGMTAESFYTYCGMPASDDDIDNWTDTHSSAQGFNTSYAAAYGPWSSAVLVATGSVRKLPGSYVQLVRWAQSLSEGSPLWFAPAGVKRADLGGLVRSTVYPVGSAVLDLWQNQEDISDSARGSYKVNPIMKLNQYGYVIYGNSTLLRNREDGATSMLQSLSTRVLANMIKDQAFQISLRLQFDQLDDDLFAEFKTLMTTFMDQLKYGRALYDYEIVADRSNLTLDDLNRRTVPVIIRISPNPAVENFVINLEISQAGVSFNGEGDLNTTDQEVFIRES